MGQQVLTPGGTRIRQATPEEHVRARRERRRTDAFVEFGGRWASVKTDSAEVGAERGLEASADRRSEW